MQRVLRRFSVHYMRQASQDSRSCVSDSGCVNRPEVRASFLAFSTFLLTSILTAANQMLNYILPSLVVLSRKQMQFVSKLSVCPDRVTLMSQESDSRRKTDFLSRIDYVEPMITLFAQAVTGHGRSASGDAAAALPVWARISASKRAMTRASSCCSSTAPSSLAPALSPAPKPLAALAACASTAAFA